MKTSITIMTLILLAFAAAMLQTAHAAIPAVERDALIDLYNSTDGKNWISHGNWLGAAGTECTWHGVTCDAEDGNVIDIDISSNNLNGAISSSIGNFTQMKTLDLSGNCLSGNIPIELKNLPLIDNGGIDLRWNALFTPDSDDLEQKLLYSFLYAKQIGHDWESTQTIAPTNLAAHTLTSTSILLTWKAIDYTENEGGYETWYSSTSGEPYDLYETTSNKGDESTTVTDLEPETDYYFRVRTMTDPHDHNPISVFSEYTNEVSATTEKCPEPEMTITPNQGSTVGGTGVVITGNNFVPGAKITFGDDVANGFVTSYYVICGAPPHAPGTVDVTVTNPDGTSAICKGCYTYTEGIPPAEREALLALYEHTNGQHWTNKANWHENGDFAQYGTECTWFGVTCNEEHTHVTKISLPINGLSGEFPASIASLTHLTSINLAFNTLSGELSSSISSLINLTHINLASAELSGEIPASIGELRNLRELDLSGNALTGELPMELGVLSNLEKLDFGNNDLNGAIPEWSPGNLPNLKELVTPKKGPSSNLWRMKTERRR